MVIKSHFQIHSWRRRSRREFSESLGAGAVLLAADLIWIRKWLERIVLFKSAINRPTSKTGLAIDRDVRSKPGQDWQEWPREFEIPICHQAVLWPRMTSSSILSGCLSCKRRRTDGKDFDHIPQHHKPWHMCEILFPPKFPFEDVWGPVGQWLVQRFRSERLRVRSTARSAPPPPPTHTHTHTHMHVRARTHTHTHSHQRKK